MSEKSIKVNKNGLDWLGCIGVWTKKGNVKNLNYQEEMEKLNELKKQQLYEKSQYSSKDS